MARELEHLTAALSLALDYLGQFEPGDSRAVSDEFVAMFGIQCDPTDADGRCMAVINKAKARLEANPLPRIEPEVTITFGDALSTRPLLEGIDKASFVAGYRAAYAKNGQDQTEARVSYISMMAEDVYEADYASPTPGEPNET